MRKSFLEYTLVALIFVCLLFVTFQLGRVNQENSNTKIQQLNKLNQQTTDTIIDMAPATNIDKTPIIFSN